MAHQRALAGGRWLVARRLPFSSAAAFAGEGGSEEPSREGAGQAASRNTRRTTQGGAGKLKRRVTKSGAWQRMDEAKATKLAEVFEQFAGLLSPLTLLWPSADKRAAAIAEMEQAAADVKLVMVRRSPRSLLSAQPHLHASAAPLRTDYAWSERGVWSELGWEDLTQLSPQQRVMELGGSDLLLMIYGSPLGTEAIDADEKKESERQQRWDQTPRELKAAIRRLHENLGHASVTEMLRALRISRASVAAVKACRLFVCDLCKRTQRPHLARPSKLPTVDEFNVVVQRTMVRQSGNS